MSREWGCRRPRRHPPGLLIVVMSFAAACGGAASPATEPTASEATSTAPTRPSPQATTSATSAAPTISWYGDQLSPGDCFNDVFDLDGEFDFSSPPLVVDCDDLHDNEVIAAYHAPTEASYPGDDVFETEGDDVCSTAYQDFVGAEAGPLDWFSMWPLEDSWDEGGRQAICAVFLPDGPVVGSMRGIGLAARPAELPAHAPIPPGAVFERLADTENGTRVGMFLILDSELESALAATTEAAADEEGDLVVVGTTGTLVHLEYTVGAERNPISIRQDDTVVRWWIYYHPEES